MDELVFTNIGGQLCRLLFCPGDNGWYGCQVEPPYLKTKKCDTYLFAYLAARHSVWISAPLSTSRLSVADTGTSTAL